MGKSSKNSTPKVHTAVPPSKSAKKDKREAEDELEKGVSAKKQKRDEVAEMQKTEAKARKNKKQSSSDDSSSDSEHDKKPAAKVAVPSKNQSAKNGTLNTQKKKGKPAISSGSSKSSDDDSDDDELAASSKKLPAAGDLGKNISAKKVDSNSTSDGSSDEDDKDGAKTVSNAKLEPVSEGPVKKSSDSSDKSDLSEEEETSLDSHSEDEKKTVKVSNGNKKLAPVKKTAKKESSGSSSETDSSDDGGKMDINEDNSSEETDEEARKRKLKVLPNAAPNTQKPDVKAADKNTSSDSSDGDDDDSFDDIEKKHVVKKPAKDSESSEDSEEETKEKPSKTHQKNPTTPSTLKEQHASKTVYVRNLSYSVEQADMEDLFKDCGEIVDIRLHTDKEGRFRGFGHVEFATAEAAQNALELDGKELLRRAVKIGIAREKSEYTPNSSNLSNSIQKCGRVQSQTIFVKGFDRSLADEEIKTRLKEHFSSCGEITRISIPKDYDSGAFKGFAYLDFKDVDSFKKALELHETKLGGYPLTVEEAKPRVDNQGTGSSRGGGRQFGGWGEGGRGGRGQERWWR